MIDGDKLIKIIQQETGIENFTITTSDDTIIFHIWDDYHKSINKLLLSNLGISEEEIKYFLELSEDDIKNTKKIIRIKQLKKELEELENDINK